MNNKKKKLRLSWWQELIYLLLSVGGPIVTIYLAALIHNPKPKYIAFMTVFFLGIIAWMLISKLIIGPWKTKIMAQIGTLELNYQTMVGSEEATKNMWKGLQLKLFAWQSLSVIFFGFIIYYILVGVAAWIKYLTLYSLIIFVLVLAGMAFKTFCLVYQHKEKLKEETTEPAKE